MRSIFHILSLVLIIGCSQVSKEIHNKFQVIDKQLQTHVEANLDSAQTLIDQYSANPELAKIQNLTVEVHKYLKQFRIDFIDYLSEGYDGEQIDLGNFTNTKEFILGNNKNGEGYVLETKLREYINSINKISPDLSFQHIARNGKELKSLEGTSYVDYDFVKLSFEDIPAIAALASLSEYHVQVTEVQLKAIEILIK